MSIVNSRKVPGKNQLIVDISISIPIRLSSTNVTLSLTNDALISYTMATLSNSLYRFDILYKSTIQNTKLTLTLNLGRARLLE